MTRLKTADLGPRAALLALALAGCVRGPATTAPARGGLTRRALGAYLDSAVGTEPFRASHWGILIVDAERGDTIYSRNAGKLFMPASNQKILTGSTALHQLGPDFRFRTDFLAGGPIRGDTLFGDLVVVGRGDPTLSDAMRGDAMAPMREIADSLHARGVRHITGRLVRGGDAFPDANWGFGWGWDDFYYPYGAGVDELFFNDGFAKVLVRGGATPGSAVTVTVGPTPIYPNVVVEARTGEAPPPGAARPRNSLDAVWATGVYAFQNGVVLSGEIAPGDTATVEVAYPDVAIGYLAALEQAIFDRGITQPAGIQTTGRVTADSAARLTPLFSTLSPPLREILPVMEKPSQNQIAEILFKTLGLEKKGVGSADSGRRVVEEQLREWGARDDGFAVRDGSGLSRHDYVSPETLVRVLDVMRRHPQFQLFYDALPVAGVDGTLRSRMQGTPAQGNVHAKTGTIDKARSLSGYVTTADGRRLVFSMLSNNHTVATREVDRVVDSTLARIAATRLR
ncbi:MAG: D-alanyl-D-alanine carboxypeptidase/D-alanyl-D-alanine-endopeptidase [Gemmatimonadaceae bacterium]